MSQWITVDSIINDYISESEQSIHKYAKLAQIAYRGMDDLGIDFFYDVKTVKVAIDANGTARMPPNINWIKVGVFTSQGTFIPLRQNLKLTSYGCLNPNRKTVNNTNGNAFDLGYSVSSPCFYNYCGYGYLYGYGWSNAYSFNVDEKNDVIYFDNWSDLTEVVVEIMCAPTEGEEYYVPYVFREPLIEWIGWRDIKNLPMSRRGNLGDKRDRKHDYYNARRLAESRYRPFNLEQSKMV